MTKKKKKAILTSVVRLDGDQLNQKIIDGAKLAAKISKLTKEFEVLKDEIKGHVALAWPEDKDNVWTIESLDKYQVMAVMVEPTAPITPSAVKDLLRTLDKVKAFDGIVNVAVDRLTKLVGEDAVKGLQVKTGTKEYRLTFGVKP